MNGIARFAYLKKIVYEIRSVPSRIQAFSIFASAHQSVKYVLLRLDIVDMHLAVLVLTCSEYFRQGFLKTRGHLEVLLICKFIVQRLKFFVFFASLIKVFLVCKLCRK